MAAETTKPAVPAIVKPPLASGGRVAPIVPDNFESAYRLAGVIKAAGMAPKSLTSQEQVTVAILHGMEVGLTPMAALQSIAVVNGMPTIWGDGMLGLVQASGLMEEIIESVERDKDGSPLYAVCRVKRVGRAEWTEQSFSRAEAQKAGLWSKQGPWTQYPRRMLQMRARAWALRDAFPDVLRGLHSAEEATDMRDVTPQGSHTVIPPEPRRSDFNAPDNVADVTQEQTEARDEVRQDDDAPVLYELFDHSGEQIGEYPANEWVAVFDGQTPKPAAKRERHQHFANNEDTARALYQLDNGELRKALADRFPDLAQANMLSGAK